jgi:hypothetical protein
MSSNPGDVFYKIYSVMGRLRPDDWIGTKRKLQIGVAFLKGMLLNSIHMKLKYILLVLASVSLLSLTGCGPKEETTTPAATNTTVKPSSTNAPAAPAATNAPASTNAAK